MVTIMDGKSLAEEIKRDVTKRALAIKEETGVTPTLVTVLVGEDSASSTYVNGKCRDCEEVGIDFVLHELSASISERELLGLINELNCDSKVHGIVVQYPLPRHIDRRRIMASVQPQKDVDGLHPYNIGQLWLGNYNLDTALLPCTPKGIMTLLDRYKLKLEGKLAVIINRSDLVGKPLSKLFLDRNATVIICHSKTSKLEELARSGDVLVSAVGGRLDFAVGAEMVKEGAVVVDVGMNYIEGKLRGDVDFDRVKMKASYITQVPGGIGPMTRAMLLQNVLIAAGIQGGRSE